MTPSPAWSPPLFWRAAMLLGAGALALVARLRVTGEVPRDPRHDGAGAAGPGLILAANHISPCDPVVVAAACRTRRVAPRFMARGDMFGVPVLGAMMRHAGHIPVDRGEPTAANAVTDAARALAAGSTVLIYPEGRIGLDPGAWPERGRTGTARLALSTGATVVPVAVWGAHEVLNYTAPSGMWPFLWRALRRRPVVRVHFGAPVDLSDLTADRPGAAQAATDRIIAAITEVLIPLRPDEPDLPRFFDPTRPVETRRSRPR